MNALAPTGAAPPPLAVSEVSKRFGTVQALDRISLEFRAGEIHAILGENGAGKSTLMRVLNGMCRPDHGAVLLDALPVRLRSARDARRAGIGMVHQHFTLVEALTVAENLALSLPSKSAWQYRADQITAEAEALAERVGLEMAPADQVVGTLPVGARQRLEILKALAGSGRVLILDEPTAVLTPQEVAQLFRMLTTLRQEGRAIVFITHKLREAKEIADRITVLRRGRHVATWGAHEIAEAEVARQMVGDLAQRDEGWPRTRVDVPPGESDAAALVVSHLYVPGDDDRISLEDVTFRLGRGEILGIAGVDGNGQRELFDTLVGKRRPSGGEITIHGAAVPRMTPAAVLAAGVGHIPPDRQQEGLILDMSVAENFLLSRVILDRFSRRGVLDKAATATFADELVRQFDVRCSGNDAPVRSLSGGNQQRIVVARELAPRPRVLITVNPTRGLDIGAAAAVERALKAIATAGCGILLVSTDLDEILELSDRVRVLSRGRLGAPLERPFDLEKLGLQMAGGAVRMRTQP
jgi:simple sugar transport system ATP-binding protein